MRRAIKGWLKTGIMDGKELFPSEEGTPQGGVISPLLANIALHGLENAINKRWPSPKNLLIIVRYADDLVAIHVSLAVVIECQEVIRKWIADIGLQIHPEKTRIVHTLNKHEGQPPGSYSIAYMFANFMWGNDATGRKKRGSRRSSGPAKSLKRGTRTT